MTSFSVDPHALTTYRFAVIEAAQHLTAALVLGGSRDEQFGIVGRGFAAALDAATSIANTQAEIVGRNLNSAARVLGSNVASYVEADTLS